MQLHLSLHQEAVCPAADLSSGGWGKEVGLPQGHECHDDAPPDLRKLRHHLLFEEEILSQ